MGARSNWMLVRVLRPGEMAGELDNRVRSALSGCRRCSGFYEALGLVPVQCEVCGTRGSGWIELVEGAEPAPAVPLPQGERGAG